MLYREEAERGYHHVGELWTPGSFDLELPFGPPADQDNAITLIASTDDWDHVAAMVPGEERRSQVRRREAFIARADPAVREGPAAQLVLAAEQFVITSQQCDFGKEQGGDTWAVIAGYYWFKEWGRDTSISLEGLTLLTGRPEVAQSIIRRIAGDIRDGLIPHSIPKGSRKGSYHTADVSLWFIHAVHRYVERTGDRHILDDMLPRLVDVIHHYLNGTRFNIRVDPADGLVTQGVPDLPLTWMDAKVGDWVVTPRRGKTVEINALWFNALCVVRDWLNDSGKTADAQDLSQHIERARRSFNERFWYGAGEYLYDVVDGDSGDDPAFRPNQVFAISLPHPILQPARWKAVIQAVKTRLLTPVGLRSLAPGSPGTTPHYFGDRRSRDAAYHQGSVWPWLIGPFVDAWLRTYPDDRASARSFVEGLVADP